mmetsp:Transcript_25743/g.62008  ORF Transcript_25743/g.62008 Transcript_25743/m.62008 type:complete len:105 (+) Transcript_25743:579-893(+)
MGKWVVLTTDATLHALMEEDAVHSVSRKWQIVPGKVILLAKLGVKWQMHFGNSLTTRKEFFPLESHILILVVILELLGAAIAVVLKSTLESRVTLKLRRKTNKL